jgi:hypothetical protein
MHHWIATVYLEILVPWRLRSCGALLQPKIEKATGPAAAVESERSLKQCCRFNTALPSGWEDF